MFEMREQIEIAAPPLRVWRALTDFAGYKKWHPFVEVEGEAVEGAEVQYSFRRKAGGRHFKSEARISVCDEPKLITFDVGIPRLMRAEEWYSIEAIGGGVRLTHGARFSGILAFVTAGLARKRFPFFLQRPNQALERYLKPPVSRPGATRSTSRPKRRTKRKKR